MISGGTWHHHPLYPCFKRGFQLLWRWWPCSTLLWHCSIRCCVNKEREGRQRRRDRGGRDSGRIKWGQLLLKDVHKVVYVTWYSECDLVEGGQISKKRRDLGKEQAENTGMEHVWAEIEKENRWGSEKDKWREMRNVKTVSQWSASSALKRNKNLLFPHPPSASFSFVPASAHLVFPSCSTRHPPLPLTNLY